MRCLIDGKPADSIPLDDRGVQYGDGLFETCAVQSGEVRWLERHLARLSASCRRLGFPELDRRGLRDDIMTLVAGDETGVLKLIVTRGSSRRGYAVDGGMPVRRVLCFSAFPQWPGDPATHGIRARVCSTRLAIQPRLAGLKHLNRLEQVLARQEWQDASIREGIMCDTQERIIEGTMSNLFLVSGGLLRTACLDNCGVAGVMRSVVIDVAAEAGVQLEIGSVSRQDVQQASELFVCNSLIGIWPVVEIDGVNEYPPGAITRRLQACLQHYDDHDNNNWYAT